MRRVLAFSFLLMAISTTPLLADTFTNGGFENGTLSGWVQGGGYWYGGWPLNPATYLPGGSNYNAGGITNTVVGKGTDPITGLSTVFGDNHAARINDSNNNYSVSVISQTVSNYTDPNIYFAWAAVLEGSHGETDSDNFTLQLVDDTTGQTLYNVAYSSASAASASLFSEKNGWFYTQWQTASLDVSGNMGDTFTLSLLGSDCPYGGHAGYVYLDGFGSVDPTQTPEPSSLVLMGSGLLAIGAKVRTRFV